MEPDRQPAGHLLREPFAQIGRGFDVNLLKQRLNIIAADSVRRILLRHYLPVEKSHRNQVEQAVIRRFFGLHDGFVSLFSSTNNAKRHVEDFNINSLYGGYRKRVFIP